MAASLPPEIIDNILSFVPDVDDDKTLHTCNLICRAWAPAAQERLFEKIDIHTKRDADKFLKLLIVNAHIRRFPRLLAVHEVRDGREYMWGANYAEGSLVSTSNTGTSSIMHSIMLSVRFGQSPRGSASSAMLATNWLVALSARACPPPPSLSPSWAIVGHPRKVVVVVQLELDVHILSVRGDDRRSTCGCGRK